VAGFVQVLFAAAGDRHLHTQREWLARWQGQSRKTHQR
jgi:hypothetical protein